VIFFTFIFTYNKYKNIHKLIHKTWFSMLLFPAFYRYNWIDSSQKMLTG